MSSHSKKKVDAKAKMKEPGKANGRSTGPLTFRLDSCLNCEIALGQGTTKVAEFMLSFSETSKRTFSVLEALTSIFELSDTNSKFFPMLTSKNLVMCPNCATVLANLYKSYVELMQLSRPTANICKLVVKAEKWHDSKRDFLTTTSNTAPSPSSEDDDDEEDEEDDSDSEVEQKKRIKNERKSDDDDGEDEDEDEYIVPNGRSARSRASGSAAKTKKRKAARARNGSYYDDDESDEEYRGPKPKRKPRSSQPKGTGRVDRSRIRERITLALDGTPRKRIRRRPSQTREDDYKCLECDRIFKFECRLIKHMKTHLEKQRTQCESCEKTFPYSWMLENHVLADHEHVKPKVCSVCDLVFYRTEILENHFCTPKDQQAAERAEKPHRCELCGKAFQKLAHLTLHLRSHEDEKPMKCPHCAQKFRYEKCLSKHMQVHETAHICPLCHKEFQAKSKLNTHMQSHDVEKTYPCPNSTCDKVFRQATALHRHLKSHGGDAGAGGDEGVRFGCDNCPKSFGRKSDLSRHVRNQVCIKEEGVGKGGDDEDQDGTDKEATSDEEEAEGQGSDGDSMSPGVNSDNENTLPSSPSPLPSPQLNLSEEDSNSAPAVAPVTKIEKVEGDEIVLAMKSTPTPVADTDDSFLSE